MALANSPPTKTKVNRFILFFLIGSTTSLPLIFFGLLLTVEALEGEDLGFYLSVFLFPLIFAVALLFMLIKEKRVSEAKPRWLEFFLAGVGALYPPVLVAVILWIVWWVLYGIGRLFDPDSFGAAYSFASNVYGVLSVGFAIFLVRLNWRNVVNQLYPQIGSQSAFAQISATRKSWLIKRAIIFLIAFAVGLFFVFIFSIIFISDGDDVTIGDDFLFGLFFLVIYLFFISISAWLWLRKPEIPRGVGITNKAIARLLQPLGYKVKTLAEIKNAPTQEAAISDKMTASVDLVALSEGKSIVIDVMTDEETLHAPDWVVGSEFRTAVRYLKNVLQLPPPVEAVAVLVDIIADDTLFLYAEDQDIKVIQLSSEEVVDIITTNMSAHALQNKFASLFSSGSTMSANGSPSEDTAQKNGGRHV